MTRRVTRALRLAGKLILPVSLALTVIFGGASAAGFVAHAWILAGAGLIAAVTVGAWDTSRSQSSLVTLLGFLAALMGLGALQLLPLPSSFVLGLPGRETVAEGWRLLEIAPRSSPLSMAPGRTLGALGYLLIPLASVLVVYRLGWRRATVWIGWTIAGLGAASGLYGMAQVLIVGESELYLYEHTSRGLPVGFFANANHQASFLLMTLPFTAALIGDIRSGGIDRDAERARYIILATLGAVQLVGVLAVGSVAGYLLLAPTLLFCFLITGSRRRSFSGRTGFGLVAIVVAGILLVATSPLLEGLGKTSFSTEGTSRLGMARVTMEAIEDHIWLGSGLGTFEPVFKLYEDPASVSPTFANHAHNEYLQWTLEMGVPGLLLLGAFIAWWFWKFFWIWSAVKDDTARIRRAASVATLIVMLHSAVDYPARTPAILALSCVCLAVMTLMPRTRMKPDSEDDEAPVSRQVTL